MPKQYNVRDGRKVYPYSMILVSVTDDFSTTTTSQLIQTGALYKPRGVGRGGRFKREDTYVHLWLILLMFDRGTKFSVFSKFSKKEWSLNLKIINFKKCFELRHSYGVLEAFLVPQWWRIHLPMQDTWEMWVRSLGREDPLEEEMANHSSILAWENPWIEEPVGYSPWGHRESDAMEHMCIVQARPLSPREDK